MAEAKNETKTAPLAGVTIADMAATQRAIDAENAQADAVAQAKADALREDVPGGRFIVNGVLVNNRGKEITKDGKLKRSADAEPDAGEELP